jgi:hypothetical protein
MGKITIFVIISAAALLAGLYWLFLVPTKQLPCATMVQSMDTTGTSTRSAVTVKNITLREYEKKKGYELVVTAQESLLLPSSDVIECRGVTGSIIRQGSRVALVSAEKSVINRALHEVMFHGAVQGSFKDIFMSGADIVYNFATQKVRTDRAITYTHPLFQMTACQSRVDVQSQKIVLSKGVSTSFLYRAATDKSSN